VPTEYSHVPLVLLVPTRAHAVYSCAPGLFPAEHDGGTTRISVDGSSSMLMDLLRLDAHTPIAALPASST
jgi:hypothetical protein